MSLSETLIPTQPSAPENITIVNFTTPRMRLYGNDSEDTLENELLISIEPVSDPAPTLDELDPATETTEAPESVPASEPTTISESEPTPAADPTPASILGENISNKNFPPPGDVLAETEFVNALENEFHDLTVPAPRPIPTSKSVPAPLKSDSRANYKPTTEPPVPPGLSQQEKHENDIFVGPARARTKFKLLLVFPIALGILLGSMAIYGYWKNHNSQRQSFVSDTASYGKKPTKSYFDSLPKEDVESQKDIHQAKQSTRDNQLAYIKSLDEFADVIIDLHNGIEKGLELSEFITISMHLSQAYRNIKVSPEIQLIIDFDLSLMAKQYTQRAEGIVPMQNVAMEVQERTVYGGDESGYQLYRLAQEVRKQANALAQKWDADVKISSRSTSAATESSIGREVSGYQILQRLLECTETFITKYKGYVGSPELNHIQ